MPSKADYLVIGIGALLAVLMASWVPALVSPMSGSPSLNIKGNTLSLYDISGIDLNALKVCKEKGLM